MNTDRQTDLKVRLPTNYYLTNNICITIEMCANKLVMINWIVSVTYHPLKPFNSVQTNIALFHLRILSTKLLSYKSSIIYIYIYIFIYIYVHICINRIWHWITSKGWYAIKTNQPNQPTNRPREQKIEFISDAMSLKLILSFQFFWIVFF